MALVSFDLKLCLLRLGWGELSGEERAAGIYFRSFDIKYILMVWKRFNTTLNYHNEQISIPIICHMILLWINLYIKKKKNLICVDGGHGGASDCVHVVVGGELGRVALSYHGGPGT